MHMTVIGDRVTLLSKIIVPAILHHISKNLWTQIQFLTKIPMVFSRLLVLKYLLYIFLLHIMVLRHMPQCCNLVSVDTRRANKLQITTNPRIAQNVVVGLPKADKDGSTNDAATKPTYTSVLMSKPCAAGTSCGPADSVLKGTVVVGTIQQLFEGYHMNYIKCINLNYKSMRKESFYDLQLDVKGCRDVYDSFDKYVEVEHLEGDNKYHVEQHGLQDAKKGVLFIDFAPILQLQLKRFEYDFARDTMVKINDRYEFPLQLDLDRENVKYLSPDTDRGVHNLYTLHGSTTEVVPYACSFTKSSS